MANEAIIVELLGDRGNVVDFTIGSTNAIEKGTILKLVDPRTASGGGITTGDVIAGIAASEKAAAETEQTKLGCYQKGIFDLVVTAGATGVTLGAYVAMSGANTIRNAVAAEVEGGKVIGKALETGTAGEVIQVLVDLA